jgi:hypothetical protein
MRFGSMEIACATFWFASPCHAAANHPCIVKAAEAIPHSVGLVIKQARLRPVPAAILSTWKGKSRPIIVDVDFVAAGAGETYSFMCAVTNGAAFVQRIMN